MDDIVTPEDLAKTDGTDRAATWIRNTKPHRYKLTSERAKEIGKKGGHGMSLRKRIAASLNASRSGKYVRTPEVLKAVMVSKEERAVGVTIKDKINQAKLISAFAGANTALEYVEAIKLGMAEYELILKAWEIGMERKGRLVTPFHRHQFQELVLKMGETVHGLGPKNTINVLAEKVEVKGEVDYTELMRKITQYHEKVVDAKFTEVRQDEAKDQGTGGKLDVQEEVHISDNKDSKIIPAIPDHPHQGGDDAAKPIPVRSEMPLHSGTEDQSGRIQARVVELGDDQDQQS